MLNNRDRQELFALSTKLKTKYIIGKGNLTVKVLEMLDKALQAHELIKVSVNKNADAEIENIAMTICGRLNCHLIKIIGKTIVLYRQKPQRKKQ
ncbi:MAG: YhbY family RNA-binding protein [Bacilli bacterium]|jgi:RNA-binding protein